MFTITQLKTRKYQATTIPSPKELFSRFGFTKKTGSYTGDEQAPLPKSKIEAVADVQKLAVEPKEEV